MNNKIKNILAGLSLGIIGMGCLTGCSMSAEQMDALNKVVTKTDEVISLVEKNNKELTQSEAVRLYQYAKTRLMVNKNDVWDNMKMTILQKSNEKDCYGSVNIEQYFYRFTNGKRVVCSIGTSNNTKLINGWFEEVLPEESNDPDTILTAGTYTTYAQAYSTLIINEMDITENNIVDCKILENGNYFITASMIFEDMPFLIDVEITEDGYLLSHVSNAISDDDSSSLKKYILVTNVQYEYGVLTDSDVQANIDAYVEQESNK